MPCLVIALVLFSSANAAELSYQPAAQRQQQLRNMLKHDCGSCHGITLQGGLGSSLLAEALINKSDAFLVNTILEGRQGTAMPPWKPFLTEQEAFWLVQKLLKQQ